MRVEHVDAEADAALMRRLQGGEDLALNELMTRWQKPLIGFIFRFIGDWDEAIDIAQETFVRVYEHRHSFSNRGSFSSWLFSISSNLCRNHLRWKRRHPTVALDAGEGDDKAILEEADPGAQPWENVDKDEAAKAVKEAVQTLPDKLKAALLLFVYEELSCGEIAGALNCTIKAVENRLRRARELLARMIDPPVN